MGLDHQLGRYNQVQTFFFHSVLWVSLVIPKYIQTMPNVKCVLQCQLILHLRGICTQFHVPNICWCLFIDVTWLCFCWFLRNFSLLDAGADVLGSHGDNSDLFHGLDVPVVSGYIGDYTAQFFGGFFHKTILKIPIKGTKISMESSFFLVVAQIID